MANATPISAKFQPIFAPKERIGVFCAAGVGLLRIGERHAHAQIVPRSRPDLALCCQKTRRNARLFRAARFHHARDEELTFLHARAGQDLFLPVERAHRRHKPRLRGHHVRRRALVHPLGRAHALAHLHIGPAPAHIDREPAEVVQLRQHAVAGIGKGSPVHALLAQRAQDRLRRHAFIARHLKVPDKK